jgi:uncharacterized low-complexity protein
MAADGRKDKCISLDWQRGSWAVMKSSRSAYVVHFFYQQRSYTMKKSIVSIAVGSVFVASAALAPAAYAADNPFSGAKLDSGNQLAQADTKTDTKAKDGKCGAGKTSDAKCGANKAADGKCGADKAKEGVDKKKDGKCGEAKCGANKKAEEKK